MQAAFYAAPGGSLALVGAGRGLNPLESGGKRELPAGSDAPKPRAAHKGPLPSNVPFLAVPPPQEPGATPGGAPRPGAMHCEVAEAHSDKRPTEAPGAPGPGRGPAHMAFRVSVSGGGCGDGASRELLSRPPAPPPRAHDLLRPRSPRDYGATKAAVPGKGECGPATRGRAGGGRSAGCPGRRRRNRPGNWVPLSPKLLGVSVLVWGSPFYERCLSAKHLI